MATPSAQSPIPPGRQARAMATLASLSQQNIELQNRQPVTNAHSGSLSPLSNASRNSIDSGGSTDNAASLLGNKSSLSLGKLKTFTL